MSSKKAVAVWLKHVKKNDIKTAGGKGAKLGELLHAKFNVPDGFVVTADFYRDSISRSGITPKISQILSELNFSSETEINVASKKLRSLINSLRFDADEKRKILAMYRRIGGPAAVRSSATAEDLKKASFAGQQETLLNVYEKTLINSIKQCMSSLYTPRAIIYRHEMGVDSTQPSIAVVVQKMVDARAAGVAFSVNPSTNNENELVIEAAVGLGEAVASGRVTPDRYIISKGNKISERIIQKAAPVLSDKEAKGIALVVNKIADYFKAPQDVEWAIDTKGKLHVLQSRPITTLQNTTALKRKRIITREYGVQYSGLPLGSLSNESKFIIPRPVHVKEIEGAAASCGRARGKVIIVKTVADLGKVKRGDVLVAVTTHPDYVPAMRKAYAIVTDEGGITSHAAIVSRELNLPCVVGTKIATKVLRDGDNVEVDGDSGRVFRL